MREVALHPRLRHRRRSAETRTKRGRKRARPEARPFLPAPVHEWRDRHSGPDPERAYALRPVDLVRRDGDEVAKRSVHRELSIGLRRIDMDERAHITRQRRKRRNRLDDSDLVVDRKSTRLNYSH